MRLRAQIVPRLEAILQAVNAQPEVELLRPSYGREAERAMSEAEALRSARNEGVRGSSGGAAVGHEAGGGEGEGGYYRRGVGTPDSDASGPGEVL